MKAEAKCTIHNRFDIEVRDAITGELKQSAQAFNIVLNQMYTRLCGGSTFFVNIHFGTGTGTLAPTRTTLFTWLGTKLAVDETLVKAIPISSWKRKIVLNPEEFVGSVLSEVGIAYGTTASYLVTHAMLQDSEGNPITITKTALDVVTIYATVYVTFSSSISDLSFINMPAGNALVNWLIGGGSAPSGAFYAGEGNTAISLGDNNETESFAVLGTSANAVFTSDVPNKKRTCGATRFGVTVANGFIREINFNNVFRMKVPATGVFSGQPYAAVPVATGDGVKTKFVLPSKSIQQATKKIYLGGVETTAFTSAMTRNKSFNYFMGAKDLGVNGLAPDNIEFVRSGNIGIVAVAGGGAGTWKVFDFDFTTYKMTSRPDPAEGFGLGQISGIAMSEDGNIIAITANLAPYLVVYDWSGTAWIRRGVIDATLTPTDYFSSIDLSDNGNVLAACGQYVIKTYDWSGTAWVARPLTAKSSMYQVALNDDGSVLAIACYNGSAPGAFVYDWSGSAWVARASVPTSDNYIKSCDLSDDGNALVVGHSSIGMQAFDWNGSAWTARALVATSARPASAVAISNDKSIVIAAIDYSSSSPSLGIFSWDEGAWTTAYLANTLYTYDAYSACITKDNLYGAVSFPNSLVIIDFNKTFTEITFNTAPGAGVAITADYTVDGVHKTDQYAIDVGFSIQFGEVV